MGDLISRSALIRRVGELHEQGRVDLSYYNIVKEAAQMEPDADAEARLMTLKEVLNENECWFEAKNGLCGYGEAMLIDEMDIVDFNRIHSVSTRKISDYEKTWRCWTYKPTDAQREGTPWPD